MLTCVLAGLLGCAPVAGPPPVQRREPRCELRAGDIHCGRDRTPVDEVALAPVRSAVARRGGGLWLLDAEGALVRIDGRGRATGVIESDFIELSAAGGLVCARNMAGQVSCLADHPGDVRCGAAAPLAQVVSLPLVLARFDASDFGSLCGVDLLGMRRCFGIQRSCARACLQFPDCTAPLRCADPCRPGEPTMLFIPLEGPAANDVSFHQPGGLG